MAEEAAAVIAAVADNLTRFGQRTTRLFHGRGGFYPGLDFLVIDVYPPVLVIRLYEARPPARLLHLVGALEEFLRESLPPELRPQCFLLQSRYLFKAPWQRLKGTLPRNCRAEENGLAFKIRFMENQNIGFFPDMRLGRELVRSLAAGRRVLNLFAYTCSFSVAACAGGALHVTNMDVSKAALQTGRENHRLNGFDPGTVTFWARDILKSFGFLIRKGPFDLVIIDPPFRQGNRFRSETDYPKLVRRLPEMLAPGAHILACLNSPHLDLDFLTNLFDTPRYQLLGQKNRPPEFREQRPDQSLKICHYLYQF